MLNLGKDMKPQYTKYYIAFLDLLGFKNIINEKSCSDIFTVFLNIRNPVREVKIFQNGKWNSLIDKEAVEKINIKVMSDSILFYIPATENDALCSLVTACTWFQLKMIQLHEPILMRGGIVYGDMLAFGDIMYGPGLTSAYLLEDKLAKYPRIIMSQELVDMAFKRTSKKCHPLLQKFLFHDFDDYYSLNYISMLLNDSDNPYGVQRFTKHIKNVLTSTFDPSIIEKYRYLEKTLEKVLTQKEQVSL